MITVKSNKRGKWTHPNIQSFFSEFLLVESEKRKTQFFLNQNWPDFSILQQRFIVIEKIAKTGKNIKKHLIVSS